MTLEEAISDAARSGSVRFSVCPASTGYQANLSDDGKSFRVEMAADPVTALKKVLGVIPGASGQLRQIQPAPVEDVFS